MDPNTMTKLKRLAVYFSEELELRGEAGTVLVIVDQNDINTIAAAIAALEAIK